MRLSALATLRRDREQYKFEQTSQILKHTVHRFCLNFLRFEVKRGLFYLHFARFSKRNGQFYCFFLLLIFHLFRFQCYVSVSETNIKGQCHQIQF